MLGGGINGGTQGLFGSLSPIAPTFSFRAERAVVEVRVRHWLAQGQVGAGVVRSGTKVWVHVPGGATEADVVEIVLDGKPVLEARSGEHVGLLLRGGRSLRWIAVGTGISDSPNYINTPPSKEVELTWKDYNGPEALEWLRTAPSGDENAFASNRFRGTDNAIRFVESLYAAGAVRVVVNEENIVDEGDGDLYADALVVLLPEGLEARSRVVGICKKESDREAGEESSNAEWGDRRLRLPLVWIDSSVTRSPSQATVASLTTNHQTLLPAH